MLYGSTKTMGRAVDRGVSPSIPAEIPLIDV
jgi:hypothetical protein